VGQTRQEHKGDQEHDTQHHAVPGRAIRGMALVDLQVLGLNVDEEVQLVGRVHDVVGAHVDAGPVQEKYHATDEAELDGCEGQQDEVGDGEDRGGCRQERHFFFWVLKVGLEPTLKRSLVAITDDQCLLC
jgi:hypothetical protein